LHLLRNIRLRLNFTGLYSQALNKVFVRKVIGHSSKLHIVLARLYEVGTVELGQFVLIAIVGLLW